jgi:hypothetical protein
MGNASMIDSMLHDGLTDAMLNIHMGETAENLAKQYEISRAVSTINLRSIFIAINSTSSISVSRSSSDKLSEFGRNCTEERLL